MEELRNKLLKSIELNGRKSKETVRLSQQLDILIVKEMRGMSKIETFKKLNFKAEERIKEQRI